MAIVLKKYVTKAGKDIPYLYVDEAGYFWVRKRIGKSTPRKKLDTNVESVAKTKVLQAVKDLETEEQDRITGKNKIKSERLFVDYYAMYRKQKVDKDARQKTLDNLDDIGRTRILPFWGNLKPDEISIEKYEEFLDWHRENHVDPETGKQRQLINVFKYLIPVLVLMERKKAITRDQFPLKFELPLNEQRHHDSPKGRTIDVQTFLTIRAQYDSRYVLTADIAHDLGPRKMEVGKLKKDQVKKIKGRVFIDLSYQDTKTGIPRIIPVPELYAEELWQRAQNCKMWVFESPTDPNKHVSEDMLHYYWTCAKEKAGIKGRLRFHDLRDTAATNMVVAKLNPVVIATFLGMSILTLQKKYLKLKPEDLLIVADTMVALRTEGAA
jgi:integrase